MSAVAPVMAGMGVAIFVNDFDLFICAGFGLKYNAPVVVRAVHFPEAQADGSVRVFVG